MLSTAKKYLNIADNNFIGVFLYGSQNYRLNTEDSDVDTIAIVLNSNQPKQEVTLPNGKMKVYTLKYFIDCLKRGDLECHEILYTKYRCINPIYENQLNTFIKDFSKCMSYDRIKHALHCKLDEHLCHVLWIIRNDDGVRYNKKRLYWAIRVCNQLKRINAGESFESSLVYQSDLSHDLVKIKMETDYLSLRDFNIIYKYLIEYLQASPRYLKVVSDKEEKCLSNFYTSVTSML